MRQVIERGQQLAIDHERALAARIAAGERDALAELYGRYQRPLYAYLCLLTPDRGLAEEILQDTLLAVWTGARTYKGQGSMRSWLYGIARRQAHNSLRRAKLPLTDAAELESIRSPGPDPEEAALAAATRDNLTRAIAALTPVLRETLMLTMVHELSYQEAADVLQVPIGTIRSRLSNARRALQPIIAAAEGSGR